jgi:hypothetical protein
MGVRLPLFPYCTWQGARSLIPKGTSHWQTKTIKILDNFERFLSRKDVQRRAAFVIPDPDPTATRWFRPRITEFDEDTRPELSILLEDNEFHGTIVVPDLSHILGKSYKRKRNQERLPEATLQLVDQIVAKKIEVLPIKFEPDAGDPRKNIDLSEFVESEDPERMIFQKMSDIAMDTHLRLIRVRDGAQNNRAA